MKNIFADNRSRYASVAALSVFLFILIAGCGKSSTQGDASLKKEEAFIHYELGMDYYGIGEVDKAFKEWKEAVKLDPDSEAHHMIGHVYFTRGKYEAAKKEWESILSKEPGNFMALNNLGNLYRETKKLDKAMEYYSRAKEANPRLATVYHNMGLIYLAKGDLDPAKENFLKALELDPNLSISMFQMGVVLGNEGKFKEAVKFFSSMATDAREDPGFNPKLVGFSSLGKLYLRMKNFPESEKYIKKSLKIQPSNPELHYTLGNVYEEQGESQQAVGEYKRALRIDPAFPYPYNALGNIYAETGKELDEAEKLLLKGMEIDSNLKSYFLDSLGWVYFKQGRLDDALAKLEEAIKLTPTENGESLSNKYYHLGMVYKAKGDKSKARENLKKSIETFPAGDGAKKAKKIVG